MGKPGDTRESYRTDETPYPDDLSEESIIQSDGLLNHSPLPDIPPNDYRNQHRLTKDKSTLTSSLPQDNGYSSDYDQPDIMSPNMPKRMDVPTELDQKERRKDHVKLTIKGNKRVFLAPTKSQAKENPSRPRQRLKLDWVYGYRGRDARNNLFVLSSGELVYNVATVVVIYNPTSEKQRHYSEHTEDITSIALHPDPDRHLVATGQGSGHGVHTWAHVRVWDTYSLQTLSVFGQGDFQTAIMSLDFAKKCGQLGLGALLVAVENSSKHTLSVWQWKTQQLVAKTATVSDTVIRALVHPKNDCCIVTHGYQHVHFWRLFWNDDENSENHTTARLLRDKSSGNFPDDYLPSYVTSLIFSITGDVITGDSNGSLSLYQANSEEAYVYNEILSENMRNSHKKGVFALVFLTDDTLVSGGGSQFKLWDAHDSYSLKQSIEMDAAYGSIRTLCSASSNTTHVDRLMFVGTTNNMILEGSLLDKFNPVVQGPGREMLSVIITENEYSFITVGLDQTVKKSSILFHKNDWSTQLEKPCLCADIHPAGEVVAVGATIGRFIVLNYQSGAHLVTMQCSTQKLGILKFSPDGNYLAVGSNDGNIHIFSVGGDGQYYKRHEDGILQGHENSVTHIDWSKSSVRLQSVSKDYDLLYWDISKMNQLDEESCRNTRWATQTCVLGYNLSGAWTAALENHELTSAAVSRSGRLLAVGDNCGAIKLYRYPCIGEKALCRNYKPYSSHVNNVAFSFDDRYLLSSGGIDAGVMQWIVQDTVV